MSSHIATLRVKYHLRKFILVIYDSHITFKFFLIRLEFYVH